MAIASVMMEISTSCPRCRKPIHLNGAAESTVCGSCHAPLALPEAFWRMLLTDPITKGVGFAEREGSTSTVMSGEFGLTLQLRYGRLAARCAKCKSPLATDTLTAALATHPDSHIACSCGASWRVRRPPAWFASVHPAVVALVGETLGADTAGAPQAPPRMFCFGCGAAVPLDGSSRNVVCGYCQQHIMLPDEVWLRLHPAQTAEGWFALLDLGDSLGVMPTSCWDFTDLTITARGHLIIAYHADDDGDAGHPCRIAAIDRAGLVVWSQDGVEFDDRAKLRVSPLDGQIALIDPEKDFVRFFDPASGKPLRTLRGPAEDDAPGFSVYEHGGVVIDFDGTLIVAREYGRSLRRYDRDGKEMPLWSGRTARSKDRPEWPYIPHGPVALPHDAKLFPGWDGHLYLVDGKGKHVAQLARDGTCRGVLTWKDSPFEDVLGFGVDRAGQMTVLFAHAQHLRDGAWSHLARVSPRGDITLWKGPHAPPEQGLIGRSDDCLQLAPDGTVYVGRDLDSLRIFAPDGRLLWRSLATDEDALRRELEQARRPKKSARDAEDERDDDA